MKNAMRLLREKVCSGTGLRRLCGYGALAALLTILGFASCAYRERMAATDDDTPPRAAVAVHAPEVTPEPTEEPVVWVWPLEGEIVGDYAPEEPAWSGTLEQWQTHPALDIAGSPGEAVYACRDGEVIDAWNDRLWGNTIVVGHGDGYRSTYSALGTLRLVAPGDAVTAGQVISAVGNTAACEAALPSHLHFELTRDGEPVDFAAVAAGVE